MPSVDFLHLSTQERLDLIGEIWSTLEPGSLPVPATQVLDIKRRLATLDEDVANSRDAADVVADLRNRLR